MPDGVTPERFEVVANFLSHPRNRRIRVIAAGSRPTTRACASLTDLYPGVNFAEREIYDLFGVEFTATPISPASSCPTTGWATRCARTTRPPRAGHVQGRPEPAMTEEPRDSVDELVEVSDVDPITLTDDPEDRRLEAQTDEGAQQLRPLAGASRTKELVLTGGPWPDDSTTR